MGRLPPQPPPPPPPSPPSSPGIGRAIVEKLVEQDINVVLVALDNDLLKDFYAELVRTKKHLQFRAVGVDLSRGDYMTPIIDNTKDLPIKLVFNNAGYITAGFFADVPLERSLGNYECNATCALKITHHFLNTMQAQNLKGLIAFTSSSAGAFCFFFCGGLIHIRMVWAVSLMTVVSPFFLCFPGFVPNPLSSMYASTKAFLTMFATSLAPEIRSSGIDVVVVHPSPMATNFFDSACECGLIGFWGPGVWHFCLTFSSANYHSHPERADGIQEAGQQALGDWFVFFSCLE